MIMNLYISPILARERLSTDSLENSLTNSISAPARLWLVGTISSHSTDVWWMADSIGALPQSTS